MKRLIVCFLFFLVAACARPLTEAENKFAREFFGPSLDVEKVRILKGPKLHIGAAQEGVRVMRGTERSCVRTPQPRGSQPPEAFALRNSMYFSGDLQVEDMALAWPRGMRFPQMLIFAHELTHVWQWQNREVTGYSPWRAIWESLSLTDPYFSLPDDAPVFLSFGYEQQAAIVEDYVCFTVANPTHPRRAQLRALLEPVFPVDEFDATIDRRGLIPR